MPTCLMVAYYFPPGGGVGVQRSLKFAKYLPEFGWRPVVLTTKTPLGIPRDEIFLPEIPVEAKVFRTAPLFSTAGCFEANRGFIKRLGCATLMLPDPIIPWVLPAVRSGMEAIRRESVTAIYSTSPPHSSHLVGGLLKHQTGLPWVADFRDAWLTDPDRNRALHNRLRTATVERWLEGWVIRNADRVVTVSEPIREDFLRRYPGMPSEKVVVIFNGYDPDDFVNLERYENSVFTFVFTGSLSKQNRHPDPLIEGAKALLVQHPEFSERFQILLVGPHTAEQKSLAARNGLGQVVRLVGPVSYQEALTYQVNANVNVLIYSGPVDGRSAQMMSSKIFEYIGARRPILAIAPPDTAATRLVEDLQIGRTAPPGSPMQIAQAIYALLMGTVLPGLSADPLRIYQRQYQTQQLAGVLYDAVSS